MVLKYSEEGEVAVKFYESDADGCSVFPYIWTSSVHLQCSDRCNQHHHIGPQTWRSAFDVEEFLHPDVRAKTSFSHWEDTDEMFLHEAQLYRNYTRVYL